MAFATPRLPKLNDFPDYKSMKNSLERRKFLRATLLTGGSISVGLPLLEAMLNNSGTALADDTTLPTCFGIWFAGGGVAPGAFVPGSTGENWALPNADQRLDMMRALEPESLWASSEAAYSYPDAEHAFGRMSGPELRALFSLVSGLKVPSGSNGNYAQHRSGQTCVFTASRERHNGTSFIMSAPTADQVVAELLGTRPLLLEVADGLPIAETESLNQTFLSWKKAADGSAVPVTPHYSALSAFEDLFGSGPPLSTNESDAKRSVLDYIRPQLSKLQTQVSQADKLRLDEHFTALREVEADLSAAASACSPDAPAPAEFDLKTNHDAMIRIAALALSCGVRNVFQLVATKVQSQYKIPGGDTGQHSLQHGGFLGDGLHTTEKLKAAIAAQATASRELRLRRMPQIRKTVRYQMDLYADMLEHFASISHGAGTLLDACALVGSFEMWDGNHHGYEEHPLMIGGSANGRLKTGVHIRDENQTSPSEVMLAAMQAAVGDATLLPTWGADENGWNWAAESGYGELEA